MTLYDAMVSLDMTKNTSNKRKKQTERHKNFSVSKDTTKRVKI